MLYRRENFPSEDELVLCTVTKVLNHAIFVNIDEYDRGGLIHISEVASGRIRNIREFVELGKKIVCKVLRTDAERGHIDLSLRRVSEIEKKKKLEDIKQEQKAEKLVELVAQQLGQKVNAVYEALTGNVFEHYSFVYQFFRDVADGKADISAFVADQKLAGVIKEHVQERFKAAKVSIKGVITIKTYAPAGVEIIKSTLGEVQEKWNGHLSLGYLGGGKYRMKLEAGTYKDAEHALMDINKLIEKNITSTDGEAGFIREGE